MSWAIDEYFKTFDEARAHLDKLLEDQKNGKYHKDVEFIIFKEDCGEYSVNID